MARRLWKLVTGLAALALIATILVWVNLWRIQDRLFTRAAATLEIRTTAVAGPVHMLTAHRRDGRRQLGAVSASIGPDGVLLVDSMHDGLAAQLTAELDALGGSARRFLFLSHAHPDHVGGARSLRAGATVIAHSGVAERLAQGQRTPWFLPSMPAQRDRLPDRTFEETYSLHFNGEEVRAIHYPAAHTDSDAVVYFASSRVLHAGDLFNGHGQLSTPSRHHGGTPDGLVAALSDLLDRLPEDTRIIPGHGNGVATIDDLRTYHGQLTAAITTVRQGLAAGQSAEAIQAEVLAARPGGDERDAKTWARTLYQHLRRE